jgi:hypothetical protein
VRNWNCKQCDRDQKQPSNLSFHKILLEWIGPSFFGSAAKLIEESLFERAATNLLRIRSTEFPEVRQIRPQVLIWQGFNWLGFIYRRLTVTQMETPRNIRIDTWAENL